jgi:hypothetical protein
MYGMLQLKEKIDRERLQRNKERASHADRDGDTAAA